MHNHPLAKIDPDGQFAFLALPLLKFVAPMVIGAVAEACLPPLVVCLEQYAGGTMLAALATGIVSGYNGGVFESSAYSADAGSFMSETVGKMIGTALSCGSPKSMVNLGKNCLTREISIVGNKSLTAAGSQIIKGGKKITSNATSHTTDKVTQTAGRHFVTKNCNTPNVHSVIKETIQGSGHITSKIKISGTEALDTGIEFLGKGYREIGKKGSGIYKSMDGSRQFRIDSNSLLGKHSPYQPHVHLEIFKPGMKVPHVNNHIIFYD